MRGAFPSWLHTCSSHIAPRVTELTASLKVLFSSKVDVLFRNHSSPQPFPPPKGPEVSGHAFPPALSVHCKVGRRSGFSCLDLNLAPTTHCVCDDQISQNSGFLVCKMWVTTVPSVGSQGSEVIMKEAVRHAVGAW